MSIRVEALGLEALVVTGKAAIQLRLQHAVEIASAKHIPHVDAFDLGAIATKPPRVGLVDQQVTILLVSDRHQVFAALDQLAILVQALGAGVALVEHPIEGGCEQG